MGERLNSENWNKLLVYGIWAIVVAEWMRFCLSKGDMTEDARSADVGSNARTRDETSRATRTSTITHSGVLTTLLNKSHECHPIPICDALVRDLILMCRDYDRVSSGKPDTHPLIDGFQHCRVAKAVPKEGIVN